MTTCSRNKHTYTFNKPISFPEELTASLHDPDNIPVHVSGQRCESVSHSAVFDFLWPEFWSMKCEHGPPKNLLHWSSFSSSVCWLIADALGDLGSHKLKMVKSPSACVLENVLLIGLYMTKRSTFIVSSSWEFQGLLLQQLELPYLLFLFIIYYYKKTLAPWKKSYDRPRQHIKKLETLLCQ